MKNKILVLIFTIFLTANAGYSMPANAALGKFLFVMIGVLLSSLIIFICLLAYRKYHNDDNLEPEILQHPKTKDEAIKFFIRKNKIQ